MTRGEENNGKVHTLQKGSAGLDCDMSTLWWHKWPQPIEKKTKGGEIMDIILRVTNEEFTEMCEMANNSCRECVEDLIYDRLDANGEDLPGYNIYVKIEGYYEDE